ncbi:MAG: helix-turn-helix domain-containing protein [Bdellovibrionales bacterium]|nr:helix-turn-helix domain-containing protein [Bdellovibrionales bacterium]
MLDYYMSQLGFSDKESAVFICLFEGGELGAAEISKRVNLPRSTVYAVLEQLCAKDLVNQSEESSSTRFSAAGPSVFLNMVESEKAELKRKERSAQLLAEFLQSQFNQPGLNVPKIKFYSGKKEIEYMLHANFESWRKEVAEIDYTWWGYQDDHFVRQYKRFLEMLWKTSFDEERVCLFSNKSSMEDELIGKINGRTIRQLPKEFHFDSTIWVLGSQIVMISTHGKPHYAFQLRDRTFAGNLRLVFSLLWKLTST